MSTEAPYGTLSDNEVFLYRHDSVVPTEIAYSDFTPIGFDDGGLNPPVIMLDCSEFIYSEYLQSVVEGEDENIPLDFTFELIFDYEEPEWQLSLFEVTWLDTAVAQFPVEYSKSIIQSLLHHGRYVVAFSFRDVDDVPDSCTDCSDNLDIPHIALRTEYDIYSERKDFYRGMENAIGEPVNYYIGDGGKVDRMIAREA